MSDEKILVIEDESAIRDLIQMNLHMNGFTNVEAMPDGETGLKKAQEWHPDLILLDLMLPGMDGLTVCRRLMEAQETAKIPIIMLTAKSEESDIVLGLEMGASDYVTKPFSNKILISRIRAQLRRNTEPAESAPSRNIQRGMLTISPLERKVLLEKQPVELTYSEFEILLMLARHPGRVYTRWQIISQIKGDDYPVTERSVDVQILNLRRKLNDWGANIETVRGIGYRMSEDVVNS